MRIEKSIKFLVKNEWKFFIKRISFFVSWVEGIRKKNKKNKIKQKDR